MSLFRREAHEVSQGEASLTSFRAMEIIMASKNTFKVGRNASTGKFVPVKTAQRYKTTHVVETMKKPK